MQLAQSNAILIYAGKLAGLYPWDPLAALKVEEFIGNKDDISLIPIILITVIILSIFCCYVGALLRPTYYEKDVAKRDALRLEIANGPWKVTLFASVLKLVSESVV